MRSDLRTMHLFLLAHHSKSKSERCIHIPLAGRSIAVCARCLGLYPALLGALFIQVILKLHQPCPWDYWISIGGIIPGLFDWGLNRLDASWGRNRWRFVTGFIAGLALGRSFLLYFIDPQNEVFWVQLMFIGIAIFAFEMVKKFELSRLG